MGYAGRSMTRPQQVDKTYSHEYDWKTITDGRKLTEALVITITDGRKLTKALVITITDGRKSTEALVIIIQ